MCKRLITTHLTIFSILCFLLLMQVAHAQAEQSGKEGSKYLLSDVKSDLADDSLTITMYGNSHPTFTSRELYDPYRLILDLAEVDFGKDVDINKLIPANKIAQLEAKEVAGLKPETTRFTFTLKDGFMQKVERDGNNLVVKIMSTSASGKTAKASTAAPMQDGATSEKLRKFLESSSGSEEEGMAMGDGEAAAEEMLKDFDLSGYKRERITIDFYKMDLHNVFRLFRQVSGMNLIVDEEVSGSLTLALEDVPWDFALDIILNLAELKKVERFNTIVVYPNDKEFEWPQRAEDNLSFETNLEVVEQEALIIQQSANQPKEIMQAKDLMRKARKKEKSNDFEDAAKLYAEAVELWPANSKLSSKLAAIYLVRLGMNAKGVYYAKKSLEAKQDNYKAALYAAIGNANMNKIPEAIEYFSQSISGNPPMKEALASFAAFSENNNRLSAALKLYEKYESIYGETVNTMVAKARIYDSMGMTDKATGQYRSVVASGFQIPTSLKKYIQGRLAE